jgi:hypothetical protein
MAVKRVLSILVALAVMLLPAGMTGVAAAAAPEMAAMADHCAGQPQPDSPKAPESCCVIACSALPEGQRGLPAPLPPAVTYVAEVHSIRRGLPAEAATPPPRFS